MSIADCSAVRLGNRPGLVQLAIPREQNAPDPCSAQCGRLKISFEGISCDQHFGCGLVDYHCRCSAPSARLGSKLEHSWRMTANALPEDYSDRYQNRNQRRNSKKHKCQRKGMKWLPKPRPSRRPDGPPKAFIRERCAIRIFFHSDILAEQRD